MLQSAIAFLLASVAVATYWVNRRGETRDLASHLYVESVSADRTTLAEPNASGQRGTGSVIVTVRNAASTPIQNLHVYLFDGGSRSSRWRIHRDPTRWWTGSCRGHQLLPVIGSVSQGCAVFGCPADAQNGGAAFPPIVLVFTDGRGARWVRFPDGRLKWRAWWQPRGPGDSLIDDTLA